MQLQIMLPLQIKSYNDDFFRSRVKWNSESMSDSKKLAESLRQMARDMIRKVFSNIDDFPEVYFTAGITESIDYLISKQPTEAQKTDYRYIFTHNTVTTQPANIMYISYPYSASGKFLDLPTEPRLIVDCAYLFASNMQSLSLIPNNVDHILFSVSKSHNLADLRCGWFFSRQRILSYHLSQYEYSYVNSMHHRILEIIQHYPLNFLYQTHRAELSDIYARHNLLETDVNLFALKNYRRIPYYIL